MRRLLLIFCALLIVVPASAQLRKTDVLLTDSGKLFRIESIQASEYNETAEAKIETNSISFLTLTIQEDGVTTSLEIPASLDGGRNVEPSLAYDPADDRLYVFWQRIPAVTSSELLFATLKDGVWTPATAFDNGIWRYRFNLRIGITHFVWSMNSAGEATRTPTLIAHAVWWEQAGPRESARYAMLNLDEGNVISVSVHEMSEFTDHSPREPYELPEGYDKSIFRTPFIFDVADSDSIDVLFADWNTNRYSVVNITPFLDQKNGVLHIPIGVQTSDMDPPGVRMRDVDNELKAIKSGMTRGDTEFLLYLADDDAIDYVFYRDGEWTEQNTIMLDERITRADGIDALRRNIHKE